MEFLSVKLRWSLSDRLRCHLLWSCVGGGIEGMGGGGGGRCVNGMERGVLCQ